jgi:hypothetical protein
MLSRIPKHVQAALKAEFHLQVKTAYTMHLNDELVAVQATVPQAALPSGDTNRNRSNPSQGRQACN